MVLLLNYRIKTVQTAGLFCIIFSVLLITLSGVSYQYPSLISSLRILVTNSDKYWSQYNSNTSNPLVFPVDRLLLNLAFSVNQIYHHNGIAYDYYSKDDLRQSKAGDQWKAWPLPNETNQNSSSDDIETSSLVVSKLPFVNAIYILTDSRLTERHNNLKKGFYHQGISAELIEWRTKWNKTTCNSDSNRIYVYQRLNLKDKPLNKQQQQRCALAMKHIDVWSEMAERKIQLGLILEDDAIFVPFFKEKFTRMIYAAIHKGILRINGTCVKPNEKPMSNDEWIHQNPMIVIGTCFNFHDQSFQKHVSNAPPVITTHKSNPSRCTHAYLLTSCSAQALLDQLFAQKNDFWPSDFMQNYLFPLSPTLQSFWVDPPLVYQGNQVVDLDKLPSFTSQTYTSLE